MRVTNLLYICDSIDLDCRPQQSKLIHNGGSKDLFLDLHKQDAIDLAQNAEFANAINLQLYNT